ncbi:PhnA domain-containing protein [Simiduia sp. 21SJ11W-1]|uniref:PhnA domain-containing protein n=1 Tax=Simiduia sp. 21SJ11W-1 TaxID=2909669 RepID=UPI00209EB092|nr:alkylphosphonate utilization protein [Simiduia sp. 21SJ11W-1]UTA48174.1 PhnA domain-containing protein [Simiduia sp. 21SJ11W-1]
MSVLVALQARSDCCELCKATENLSALEVGPDAAANSDRQILACATCANQLGGNEALDENHWRCLNDAMWSSVGAVQVQAYRQLQVLATNAHWAQELLDVMYLAPELESWAKAQAAQQSVVHKDCHGNVLSAGDSVTLIKDLPVKGANFTAKRGTAVRGISLVADNPEHIEGKVEGQRIVILTQYVKKN